MRMVGLITLWGTNTPHRKDIPSPTTFPMSEMIMSFLTNLLTKKVIESATSISASMFTP